jgi:GT2 family glycosyltransferase
MRIGYVCTNYNNSAFTRKAVASLYAGSRPPDVSVAIVDNASSAGEVAALLELKDEFPEVQLVLSPRNVGYFPGLNLGIAQLRTREPGLDHIVVGNNDLVFPRDFVQRVQEQTVTFSKWAVVAPDLLASDGQHQNPYVLHPISRARRVVWDVYYQWYPLAYLIRFAARITRRLTARQETLPGHELYRTAGPIILGLGACYVLGPLFFRNFERLYAPTFLMNEEFFLCEQLATIGQSVYYEPALLVHHHGAATTGDVPSRSLWAMARDSHRMCKRLLTMSSLERRDLVMRSTGVAT